LFTFIIFNKDRSLQGFSLFILHGGWLDRPWRHCPRFFTADILYRRYFKPIVADHSSKSTKHRRLG